MHTYVNFQVKSSGKISQVNFQVFVKKHIYVILVST